MAEVEKFDLVAHRKLWVAMAVNTAYAIANGWPAPRLKDFVLADELGLTKEDDEEYPNNGCFACEWHEHATDEADEELPCELCPFQWERVRRLRDWSCMGGLYDEYNRALCHREEAKARALALRIAHLPVREGVAI